MIDPETGMRVKKVKPLDLGNFKSMAQKKASEKNVKKGQKVSKEIGKIKAKKVAKAFLKSGNLRIAAKTTGMSEVQASRYLKSDVAQLTIAESLEKAGFDNDTIAVELQDMFSKSKEMIKQQSAGGLIYETFRDGRLALSTLQQAIKSRGLDITSTEHTNNININIESGTAKLAIKSLLTKLDHEELRGIKDDIDVLLSEKAVVINQE